MSFSDLVCLRFTLYHSNPDRWDEADSPCLDVKSNSPNRYIILQLYSKSKKQSCCSVCQLLLRSDQKLVSPSQYFLTSLSRPGLSAQRSLVPTDEVNL